MDMQNYTTPFANTGDREEFNIDTDPSGKVSLEKGWTELYQLRPEEGGLFILRKVFNQMMKLVSTDTVTWKTQTFPNWIDDKGDGLPFAYPKNAIVKYTDGEIYVSLIDNNEDNPIGSANWKLFDITSLDNTVKLSDFTGTNQDLAQNGYQKLPGGLIIQWGQGNATQNNSQVNFPLTFPNKVLACSLTDGSADGSANTMHVLAYSTTVGITPSGFNLYAMNISGSFGVATAFRYLAIGH